MALCKGGAIGIYFIMLWCMILVGTFLFLRSNELLALKLKDFTKEGCFIKRNSVRTLCVKLAPGKSETKHMYFKLFRCDEMPQFCPVRILLFYVDLAGLDCQEGFLFPSKEHLIAVLRGEMLHKDAHPMSYENWRMEIKSLIKACCPELLERLWSRVGTHILRYCGYTFATWGTINYLCSLKRNRTLQSKERNAIEAQNMLPDLCFGNIMKAARHSSAKAASFYVENSTTLYWAIQELDSHEQLLQKVPQWKMNYVGTNMEDLQSLAQFAVDRQQDLGKLAPWFMHYDAGLPASRETRKTWCVQKLYNTIINQPVLDTTVGFNLADLLALKFKEDQQGLTEVMSMVMVSLEEAKQRGRQDVERDFAEGAENRARLVTPIRVRQPESDDDGARIPKRKKVSHNKSNEATDEEMEDGKLLTLETEKALFASFNQLGKKAERQKIHNLLKKVVRVKPSSCVGGGTGAVNRWRKRLLPWSTRFLECIAVCCNGDVEKFRNAEHTGKFPLTTPQCTCLK
jgi:hypothetical protein